ncbi:MAG: DNA alkylation repair protein [Magnetococcales bacterium]|nr:DNA alkylation repair protein [Magnetococcales bacterium]
MKSIFDAALATVMAERVAAHHPDFDAARFVAAVVADLPGLELKARVQRLADGLREHLPADFPAALAILLASMGADDGTGGIEGEGYDGFRHWPFLDFVGRYGLDHPVLALDALERMTLYFSAEFAIRPYILNHPELTLQRMGQWTRHPDWRVRRLASEGSRPRLPWGMRLSPFIADPSLGLAIIEPLCVDPHPVVRRSVANHLNDVAKDHPVRAVETARRWQANGDAGTRWIVGHGLRTLIKQGDPGALALMGFAAGGQPPTVTLFRLERERIVLGESLDFRVDLSCLEAGRLSIDYVVHHQRQRGTLSPKVFKWVCREVASGQILHLEKRHPIRPITTRRYYPGSHRVEVVVNGVVVCGAGFELVMPE